MADPPLPGPVRVAIVDAQSHASPAEWQVEYEIRNSGASMVWLVDDARLSLRQDGERIELSYARAPMQSNAQVFGYFNPKTVRLAPGTCLRRTVRIPWPCPLSRLWNPVREAAPAPGRYALTVRVGYARSALPPPPVPGEAIDASVLRWQRQAGSAPAIIDIPPYPGAPPA